MQNRQNYDRTIQVPPNTPTETKNANYRTLSEKMTQHAGDQTCCFCETMASTNNANPYEFCEHCDCPLTKLAKNELDENAHNQFLGLENQGRMHLFVAPNQQSTLIEVVSLSPVGLCFLSDVSLDENQIIKLQSSTLVAAARVIATNSHNAAGAHAFQSDAKFETLNFKRV